MSGPITNGQQRGPIWAGRKISTPHFVRDCPGCFVALQLQKPEPTMGFLPDSRLGQLMANPKITRRLRRMILAVVQAPLTERRRRLERKVESELRALGISPIS